MRLVLSWLKEFVDVSASAEEIAETIGLRGFEVASLEQLGGGDAVIDFEITANRPDCLSVLGLAREVATAFDRPIALPSRTITLTANSNLTISSIGSSSTQFTLGTASQSLPAQLNAHQTISVPVTFSPTQAGVVDLIVPRGGEGLKAALKAVATVPVIYAASGNNHVYVDAGADHDAAEAIVLNAKLQRPATCNAAEKLLIHEKVAEKMLPQIAERLRQAGSRLR